MRKTVLASLLFVFSFSAQAASRYWLPGTVGAFDQTENWLDGAYPGTGDSANMDVGSATISEGMDIKVGYFNVARTNTFAVVQTGGSVTVLSTSGGSDPGWHLHAFRRNGQCAGRPCGGGILGERDAGHFRERETHDNVAGGGRARIGRFRDDQFDGWRNDRGARD